MKICELQTLEKPRERLINYGAENISNEELLAIVLKCGIKNINSKELANLIIKNFNGIENLKNVSINKLSEIKGIGITKASQVLAALELGRRVYYVKNKNNVKISSTTELFNIYRSEFDYTKQEKFCAVYLDAKKKVIKFKTLFKGTLDKSTVHPREVFKEALLLSASAVIVMHNHPSGDVTPSTEDIEITNSLISSGEMLGIKLLDHIIFGNNFYYSFYEKMNKNK